MRAAAVGNLGEARLAHDALEHHAAADPHLHRIGLEPGGVTFAVGVQQLRRQRVAPEIVRVGDALRAQRA